jgi:hypothetical protein
LKAVNQRTNNTMAKRKMLKGQEKSEDTKEVIESCKSNGHKKNNKKTHKGKESITKKICICSSRGATSAA